MKISQFFSHFKNLLQEDKSAYDQYRDLCGRMYALEQNHLFLKGECRRLAEDNRRLKIYLRELVTKNDNVTR